MQKSPEARSSWISILNPIDEEKEDNITLLFKWKRWKQHLSKLFCCRCSHAVWQYGLWQLMIYSPICQLYGEKTRLYLIFHLLWHNIQGQISLNDCWKSKNKFMMGVINIHVFCNKIYWTWKLVQRSPKNVKSLCQKLLVAPQYPLSCSVVKIISS